MTPVAVVAAVVCLLEYLVHLPFERQVEFVLFFSAWACLGSTNSLETEHPNGRWTRYIMESAHIVKLIWQKNLGTHIDVTTKYGILSVTVIITKFEIFQRRSKV